MHYFIYVNSIFLGSNVKLFVIRLTKRGRKFVGCYLFWPALDLRSLMFFISSICLSLV